MILYLTQIVSMIDNHKKVTHNFLPPLLNFYIIFIDIVNYIIFCVQSKVSVYCKRVKDLNISFNDKKG